MGTAIFGSRMFATRSPATVLRVSSNSLISMLLVIATVVCGLAFWHSGIFSGRVIDLPDRSDVFRVKILPEHANDAELDKLPPTAFSYLAMIDAGSSGCRAHIYRYGKLGSISGPLYVLPQHVSMKVKPGLSSFASNPTAAGASLAPLIDFMKSKVPEEDWDVTPIWVKATAGLRMLDTAVSDKIIDSVQNFLSSKANSPFYFHETHAQIISGSEEGAYG